jgi:hypothetical protein
MVIMCITTPGTQMQVTTPVFQLFGSCSPRSLLIGFILIKGHISQSIAKKVI